MQLVWRIRQASLNLINLTDSGGLRKPQYFLFVQNICYCTQVLSFESLLSFLWYTEWIKLNDEKIQDL
jgi:hypothetical protein